MQHQIDVSE